MLRRTSWNWRARSRYKMQDTRCNSPKIVKELGICKAFFLKPQLSSIFGKLNLASCILHPASCILYPVSCILPLPLQPFHIRRQFVSPDCSILFFNRPEAAVKKCQAFYIGAFKIKNNIFPRMILYKSINQHMRST